MNRLQTELHRLFPPASDGVRTLVLELAQPADWGALGRVWRGVQADLALPAPAIAVSGTDGLQLWFSLQQSVSDARACAFLARLQARYLAELAPARVRTMPSATTPAWQAAPVPAQQAVTENWSAFVAPDLAPVFADTPWLDIEPGAEGQADLLARLDAIPPAAFEAALQRLQGQAPAPIAAPTPAPATAPKADVQPRAFLQQVLNDETVPLALRIEAAKALLRHA